LRELKGFQKVELKAGERREVSFTIGEKDLSFLRADMTWGAEPGEFELYIGPNSRDTRRARFELLAR
jgi:beta-glucosidase